MTIPQGALLVHRQDPAVTYQVRGWARMAQGFALRRSAEESVAGGAKAVRVDLRHCTYMDSTFLGTLLFLKRASDCRGGFEFVLVCPSAPCLQMLQQTGLDAICPVVSLEEPEADVWTELTADDEDVEVCKHQVIQAHRELATLAGPAGDVFRGVAQSLEPGGKGETAPRSEKS